MTAEPVGEFDHVCRHSCIGTLEGFLSIRSSRVCRARSKEAEHYYDSPTNNHQARKQIRASMERRGPPR
jgi:hypothetical protein